MAAACATCFTVVSRCVISCADDDDDKTIMMMMMMMVGMMMTMALADDGNDDEYNHDVSGHSSFDSHPT